jgi:general secretion pathway protein I
MTMRKSCQGMTLIEVLVAFIVLSVTMVVIMQIFSGGMRNARLAESYSRAVFLAESKMAAVGLERPLAFGEESGLAGGDMQWRVSVTPAEEDPTTNAQLMPVRLYLIRVTAAWGDDGRERQVQLTSLRLGPRQ